MLFRREIYPCECGDPSHAVLVVVDDDPTPFISLSIVHHWKERSLWQRVKMAWYALTLNEHVWSEVHIDVAHQERFINFVSSLKNNESGDCQTPI